MTTATLLINVAGHGLFQVVQSDLEAALELPRTKLVEYCCATYEGCAASDTGDKPSHWRGVPKLQLAAVVADGYLRSR